MFSLNCSSGGGAGWLRVEEGKWIETWHTISLLNSRKDHHAAAAYSASYYNQSWGV